MTLQNSYVLIRSREQPNPLRVQLPVTVGATASSDIIVNAASFADSTYLLHASKNDLALLHQQSGSILPAKDLERFGLNLLGPVPGNASDHPSAAQRMKELLVKERLSASARHPIIRKITLANLPQKVRFGTYFLTWLSVALFVFARPKTPHPDLSMTPVSLAFDSVMQDQIGASKKRFGYERGITFAVTAPNQIGSKSSLLTFDAGGLNFGKEIIIQIKNNVLYTSVADPSCSNLFCAIQIPIAPGLLETGINVISLIHAPEDSSYILKNLHIQVTPPLNALEKSRIERWFEVAQRAFDERDLVPENLVLCRQELQQASSLLLARQVQKGEEEALKNRVTVLLKEADDAFLQVSRDFWAKAEMAYKLENLDQSEKYFNMILRLFPEPSSDEHQAAKEKLAAIKELRK